jgi:hypothetical protein
METKIAVKKNFVKNVKIGNEHAGNANLEFRVTAPHVCLIYTTFSKYTPNYGEMDKKQVSDLIKSLESCLAKMT